MIHWSFRKMKDVNLVIQEIMNTKKSNFKTSNLTDADISGVESALGRIFPEDYKTMLKKINGGTICLQEGSPVQAIVTLWSLENLMEMYDGYLFPKYAPEIIPIGADTGVHALCFDYRMSKNSPSIILMPYGDICYESAIKISDNFTEFLNNPSQDFL
jgi:hypothetical protein